MPGYRLNKAKLPPIINNHKAKDNRKKESKLANTAAGLLPDSKKSSRIVAPDSVQNFNPPPFTAILPHADDTPLSHLQSKAIKHLSKLPLYLKEQISTKPQSSKATMVQHLSKLPLAVNLASRSLDAYASHVIQFMNWYEAAYVRPTENTTYTVQHVFLWSLHLVDAEYSQPLTYYNSVLNALSQSYTPLGIYIYFCSTTFPFIRQITIYHLCKSLDRSKKSES